MVHEDPIPEFQLTMVAIQDILRKKRPLRPKRTKRKQAAGLFQKLNLLIFQIKFYSYLSSLQSLKTNIEYFN